MAVGFDENNDYFIVTDAAGLTFQDGDWVLGVWTFVSDNSGTNYQYIVSNGNFSANNSLNLLLDETGEGGTPDQWEAILEDGDGTAVNLASASAPGADSTWRLIIVQRRTADNEIQMWFCEEDAVATKEDSNSDAGFNAINGGDWNIGRRVDGQADRYYGSIASEIFKGDFSLSQSEIEQLAAGHTIRSIGKSPDMWLQMIASVATLPDLSGNGNTGARQSSPTTEIHSPNVTQIKRRRIW